MFESLPYAYREAFIFNGWPIDSFVHDLDTLRYFCSNLEAKDGRPALINMIIYGKEILEPNEFLSQAKAIASQALLIGPDNWNKDQINQKRFLIRNVLNDIKFPRNKEEQIISTVHLFESLTQFYHRSQ